MRGFDELLSHREMESWLGIIHLSTDSRQKLEMIDSLTAMADTLALHFLPLWPTLTLVVFFESLRFPLRAFSLPA